MPAHLTDVVIGQIKTRSAMLRFPVNNFDMAGAAWHAAINHFRLHRAVRTGSFMRAAGADLRRRSEASPDTSQSMQQPSLRQVIPLSSVLAIINMSAIHATDMHDGSSVRRIDFAAHFLFCAGIFRIDRYDEQLPLPTSLRRLACAHGACLCAAISTCVRSDDHVRHAGNSFMCNQSTTALLCF
jgi:hypothetical protein